MNANHVFLVGRLADDMLYTEATEKTSSRVVGRIIVNRVPGSNGRTNYDAIQIVAWGKTADAMAQHTSKGKELTISGELRVNNVPPAQEGGAWQNFTEVLIRSVSFGRDSNQQKMMKAVSGNSEEATQLLAAAGDTESFADLLKNNPTLRETLEGIASLGDAAATAAPDAD